MWTCSGNHRFPDSQQVLSTISEPKHAPVLGPRPAIVHFDCFQGNLRPEEALQALTIYEGKFGRLKDDREKCAKAKEALELTDTGLLSGSEERVQVGLLVLSLPLTGAASGALPEPRWFLHPWSHCSTVVISGGLRRTAGPQRRLVGTFQGLGAD